MKRFLLSAAALICAASVNAQVFQMNGEDFGFSADAADCAAGTEWGTAGSVTLSNPFATTHKLVDCKNNDYNQVIFNGTDVIVTKNGVQGQDNPKDIDGGNPGVTLVAPSTGAVVQFTAEADGYVYIVGKLSSNKNYYVFEEGTPVGFTLAMEINDERFPENKIVYTVEGEGEFNEVKDATYTTNWPVRVALKDVEAATAGNGLGVIGFPVYADCTYLVGAGGSKISWCGAYFTSKPCSVSVAGDEKAEFSLLGKGGVSGIETMEAEDAAVAVSYNLFGQKTNAATGFMIKNGSKVYVK